MDNEQWQRVETIFEQALEQAPETRGDFLRTACAGDAALLHDVEQLLRHHGAAESRGFLENTAGLTATLGPKPAPEDTYIGKDLGPYRIQKRLGQGGMGNVYLAVRHAEYRQQVAIKVLRRGMDTENILQRFRNEIQVLAAVSKHENIAGLLDAGTTEDGLPFFVMEYVEGEPLDSYCNHHRYGIKERVRLFRQVCAAVQFAHQHMIVHRDLKMSNILVRTDGVPKLIDFGIAKLTTPELGVETMAPTMPDTQFMTLEYASPEQARGGSLTTSSDVYSLGVVLYELLSGHKPYTLREVSASDRLTVICETEPVSPSSKLRQATGEQTGSEEFIASARTTRKKLQSGLSGDLDNIVLKALRKEPQRRYGTAESLSDDLERFLDGSPVDARPIGTVEYVYRWCRRHPAPTALLMAVFLVFMGGLWHLSRLSDHLIQSTAIEGAALESKTLSIVQDFYAKNIVAKVSDVVPVTHRYASFDGAIPVPASFTIDLGEHLRNSKITAMSARLYSDFPFRHRVGGGPADDFEKAALEALRQNPDRPFYRFEMYEGRQALRYATASLMKQACVNCHNGHSDSIRKGWKVGDVRGVLEIIRPLDADIIRIRNRLSETFIYMVAVSIILICLTLVFLRIGRRH